MKRFLTIAGLTAVLAAPALAQAQSSSQPDPHQTTQYLEAHGYKADVATKSTRGANSDFGGMPYQSQETRQRLAREKAAKAQAAQPAGSAKPGDPQASGPRP